MINNKFKEWLEKVEASNEAFNKMTKAEKRVQIAKDVIDRINLEQIVPSNVFLDDDKGYTFGVPFGNTPLEDGQEMKTSLNSITCSACVKGGMFLSYVGRSNNHTYDEYTGVSIEEDSKELKKLREIFTQRQLDLMELFFEGDIFSWMHDKGKRLVKANEKMVEKFHEKYIFDRRSRMIAICENIIENNGTFKPRTLKYE